ncbi:MAG: ATP-binding protein [Rikenellaceae bacterium]
MSLIKQPYEIEVEGKVKMLIYGQAGQGKTTMALSAPKPLLIDCDNGAKRINPMHIVPTVQVKDYAEILQVLNTEDLSSFETIVIDTGSKLLDLMAFYIIQRNPKMGKANGALTLQGYGERKAEFTQFCKLVATKGKHLIFVAQRETKTEGDDTRYVPLFGGSSYDSLVADLDVVGYLEHNGSGAMITFNGTNRNDGKNTCNLPPQIKVPVVVDINGNGLPNRFLEDVVFKAYNDHLAGLKALGHGFANLMTELKMEIGLITNEVAANDFIKRISEYDHIGTSKEQARVLFMEHCKKLGLVYNQELKAYERAEQSA